MGKVKKSFKKFSQSQLKQTIERRRATQKIVKDRKKREVKKLNRALLDKAKPKQQQDEILETGAFHTTVDKQADRLADMNMDEFINGEYEDAPQESGSSSSEVEFDEQEEQEEEEESLAEEEDEDEEVEEKVLSRGKQHKKDLEKLKEQDPEFYDYLQNNDKSLLNFDVSDSESEDDDDEAMNDNDDELVEEDEDDENTEDMDESAEMGDDDDVDTGGIEVTKNMLSNWEKAITKDHSLSAGKKLMQAFRAAVLSGRQSDDNNKDGESKAPLPTEFIVNNDAVFNKSITLSLQLLPTLFQHHLPSTKSSKRAGATVLPSNSQKWTTLSPLVKSFLTNLLSTFRYVNEPTILQYVLQESEKVIIYFLCFPKLASAYLKALLTIWGTGHESTRMLSFICIRQLVVLSSTLTSSTSLLDAGLKGIYTMFVKVCKDTNIHTLPVIQIMIQCIVDLMGIHLDTSYQHAFLYIRQLAIHLRNAVSAKTKEAYRSVYNWQFIHCLRLWSQVLSTYCNERFCASHGSSPLQPIIYPFVQVALGASRLIPTAQYFPLRLHCVDMLTQLGLIFEMLESTEMRRKPNPSTLKPLDLSVLIKAPKEYLHTRVYQEVLMERACEYLFDYYEGHALSIAFPELAIPATVQLRRMNKRIQSVKLIKQSQSLVEKLEQQSRYIEDKRSSIDYSPSQISKAHTFLAGTPIHSTPLGAHVASMRKIKEQRQQILQAVRIANRY
ncbi:Noc2p family-domain-containing protein [Syncephalis plumigaleata]|nr:Noc2p family-domain-containing protein [Syncephalis plumigaleata]